MECCAVDKWTVISERMPSAFRHDAVKSKPLCGPTKALFCHWHGRCLVVEMSILLLALGLL